MLRMLWNTLPSLLIVQAIGAVMLVLVPLVAVNGTVDDSPRRVAFAVPAASGNEATWGSAVDLLCARMTRAFGVQPAAANDFAAWILEASARHDLDPDLLASLVKIESQFRVHARSRRGAVGPAQVKPWIWSDFCGTSRVDLQTNPEENIYCGAQVLSHFRDRCGDQSCALQGYATGKPRAGMARLYVARIDAAIDQLRSTEI
ncbi:MAG: transglycosylase SLT domain-containing protein [Gammaproteobacteria bacterium]